ncbi:MAG: DUF6164 family protein [Thiolinea sp.]
MAAKLISLRNVLEEEAEGIRALLERHRIDYYETPPGNWGVSAPIIWIRDADDLEQAKQLLEQFEAELGERVRSEYQQLRASGQHRTLWDQLRSNPLQVILLLAAAALVLWLSIMPFVQL